MVEETSPSFHGGRILHLEILDGEMGFLKADDSEHVQRVHNLAQK